MPIFTPNSFRRDPYGWLTNQVSHVGLGIGLVWGLSLFWYKIDGELPYKEVILAILAIGYAAYEIRRQGWKGWDTIEDWIFVVVYGAGGTVLAFSELTPGRADVIVDMWVPAPFLAATSAHLLVGVTVRVWRLIVDRG